VELNCLRNATAKQHENVERDLDLLRSSFTRRDYVSLLQRFYGFLQPWESEVEPLFEVELPEFFAPRRKLPNIAADLRYLGCTDEDLASIDSCQELPTLKGIGAALGSVYVIEGSSLGGRIISRRLAGHLGVLPNAGGRFFSGYGEDTGRMWSAFGELIKGRPAAENDEMLEAAAATFDLLGEWLGSATHAGSAAHAGGAAHDE
jgi:heme oxygenase